MPNTSLYGLPDEMNGYAPSKPAPTQKQARDPNLPVLPDSIKPTIVPGLESFGPLGPDLGGAVKGSQARQEYELNNKKNIRDEEYLKIAQEDLGLKKIDMSMKQEEFGWKREDREKQVELDLGMKDAAKRGGYSAVIDFLKTADPMKAIEFHAQKLKLDEGIMKNDVMQATAQNDKNKALMESYGILGKLGSSLMNMEPKDRANAWKQIAPIAQKVDPTISSNLEEAVPKLLLAIAQGTPDNILYKNNSTIAEAQSGIGREVNDLKVAEAHARKKGLDPATDPGVQAIKNKIDTYNLKHDQAILENQEIELKQLQTKSQTESTKLKNTETVQKNYDTLSTTKNFNQFMDFYPTITGSLKALQKDPTNASAQGTLAGAMASAILKGTLTENDYNRTSIGAAGFQTLKKWAMEWSSGNKVNLLPQEISALASTFNEVAEQRYAGQTIVDQKFLTGIDKYGQNIVQDRVKIASSTYKTFKEAETFAPLISQHKLESYPVPLQVRMAKAINSGADPEAVKKRTDEYLASQEERGI